LSCWAHCLCHGIPILPKDAVGALDCRPGHFKNTGFRQSHGKSRPVPDDPDAEHADFGRRAHAGEHEDHIVDRRQCSSRKQILEARRLVSEGKSLTESLKEAGRFPLMMTQMINVGEATGSLDDMLAKLANFYDEEVEAAVNALLSILEPVMLIFVGGIVGTLIISMYLPIFSMLAEF
jgi:hypothetical protein